MPKVTIVQVIYNSKKFIEPVFTAIINQTYKDFNVVAVISGNDDGGKELLIEKFPAVEIIDPGYNIGFAAGHNLVFEKYATLTRPLDGHPLPKGEGNNEICPEFFQLVNPDMVMEPNYIEEIIKAFDNPKVGAATGKLYQISNFPASPAGRQFPIFNQSKTNIIDSTGVIISKSGRARDRGQHEIDNGQYDQNLIVDAVSGAGCMYRAAALQATSYSLLANKEYFDEDFHSYWEDVDLSWRISNAGWKNVFVPTAVGYHGRAAGSSRGGYPHVADFIKHHRALNPKTRRLNYKNHIFMYIKNSKYFYPQFFIREFFMLIYILLFEQSTLKVLPEMVKLLPKMWKKRKGVKGKASYQRQC